MEIMGILVGSAFKIPEKRNSDHSKGNITKEIYIYLSKHFEISSPVQMSSDSVQICHDLIWACSLRSEEKVIQVIGVRFNC